MEIPPGADVDDPAKDVAFMKQIGATQADDDDSVEYDPENWRPSGTEYVLTNAATGGRFRFKWTQDSGVFPSYWRLEESIF